MDPRRGAQSAIPPREDREIDDAPCRKGHLDRRVGFGGDGEKNRQLVRRVVARRGQIGGKLVVASRFERRIDQHHQIPDAGTDRTNGAVAAWHCALADCVIATGSLKLSHLADQRSLHR